jgi:molybdate transport repressor ModE-like protein
MFKVLIKPHWEIRHGGQGALDTSSLLALLTAVEHTGSIAQGAQSLGMSYRSAWGMLREVEQSFGGPLIVSGRGRGTTLTPLAKKLIWADRLIAARLSPTLESLASELETELGTLVEGKLKAVRINASHGFAVAELLKQINAAHRPLELRYRHSTDAVAAFARGDCDLAGFHIPLGQFEKPAFAHYKKWLNKRGDRLIHLAVRSQGLFAAPGNPKKIRGLADLLRSDLHFVGRQTGSGTRMLLELMLADAGIPIKKIAGFDTAEFTHSAVAAFIASGMADVGFGVQTAAHRFGLDFIPLIRERYFFAIKSSALNDPLIKPVIDILQSASFREVVDGLAGYDGADLGKILTCAEAFP